MSSEGHKEDFFPTIGSVAETTDLLPEEIDDQPQVPTAANEDTDRPLQEIESLCMNCEKQVRIPQSDLTMYWLIFTQGSNKISPYHDTILSRSHYYVFSLRTLWQSK